MHKFYSIREARAAAEEYVADPFRLATGIPHIDNELPGGGFRKGTLVLLQGLNESVYGTHRDVLQAVIAQNIGAVHITYRHPSLIENAHLIELDQTHGNVTLSTLYEQIAEASPRPTFISIESPSLIKLTDVARNVRLNPRAYKEKALQQLGVFARQMNVVIMVIDTATDTQIESCDYVLQSVDSTIILQSPQDSISFDVG